MTGRAEHDRVLAAAAREVLGSIGLRRKGTSRIYLSDEGIWSCIVEFQPSAFSAGSYLNVAAHWLWTADSHISLDYGGRVGDFLAFGDPEGFAEASRRLALSAVPAVQQLRRTFASIRDIAHFLVKAERDQAEQGSGGGWGAFNAAVASGLVGNAATAQAPFTNVAQGDASQPWMRERQAEALRLAEMTNNPGLFRATIMARVAATRSRLKMTGEVAALS